MVYPQTSLDCIFAIPSFISFLNVSSPSIRKGKHFLFGIYLGNRLESFIGREPITWYNTKTHVTWVGSQQVVWKASYTGIYHLGHSHSLSFPAPCTIRSYYLPSTRHQHAWYSQLTVNNSHMHLKSTKEASGTLKYLLKKKFPFYNKDWRARSFRGGDASTHGFDKAAVSSTTNGEAVTNIFFACFLIETTESPFGLFRLSRLPHPRLALFPACRSVLAS